MFSAGECGVSMLRKETYRHANLWENSMATSAPLQDQRAGQSTSSRDRDEAACVVKPGAVSMPMALALPILCTACGQTMHPRISTRVGACEVAAMLVAQALVLCEQTDLETRRHPPG